MARPKKKGRRRTGIQAKKGRLYIVLSQTTITDGVKSTDKKWIATGLTDTSENVKKAAEMRAKLLNTAEMSSIDINATLSDYIDYYLQKKRREVSDTTYAANYYRGRRIKEQLGDTNIRKISEMDLATFLDSLFEVHLLQERTVIDIKVFLGSIFDQAVNDGILNSNPVRKVVINRTLAAKNARDKTSDDDFFSFKEAQLFLSKVKEHALYELFYLTIFFGLRREEVLGLRWSAIDFKSKTMKISHTITKGTVINRTNTTKTTASSRSYPLNDEQLELFSQLKSREEAKRKLCGNGYTDNDYIFKHDDGSLFYPDYPTKAFRKLIKRFPELPQGITFHGLRSSCVSILVHQGMDVKSIQKWVGHADIDTTLRIYAKSKDKEAKREISDKMNGIIPVKDYPEDNSEKLEQKLEQKKKNKGSGT